MIQIDFLKYRTALKTRSKKNKSFIFDPIRKKYLVLQPEEFVRQLVLLYLIDSANYNPTRIRVEKELKLNKLRKRCDILVFDKAVNPWLLVECKAPNVNISQATFDQIARYNMPLSVNYLMVTNGLITYCCKMDYSAESYSFMESLPPYPN